MSSCSSDTGTNGELFGTLTDARFDCFTAVLMIRSQMEFDTQDIEGFNSVIQAMAKAAPALKHSLHSDRLRVKFGDGITTAKGCDLHPQVLRHQNTMEYAARFSRANLQVAPQKMLRSHLCQHRAPSLHREACDFGRGMWDVSKVTPAYVWSLDGGKGFLICWSHHYTLFVATGTTEDTGILTLEMPVVVDTFSKFLLTILPAQKLQQRTLRGLRFDAIWRSTCQAQLEGRRTFRVRPRSTKPAHPTPTAAARPEGRRLDKESAPDFPAEWIGEVVDSEADDAQQDAWHDSGATDLQPDEIDIHGHEVGRLKAPSGRGNSADVFASRGLWPATTFRPRRAGSHWRTCHGKMRQNDDSTGAMPAVDDRTSFRQTD